MELGVAETCAALGLPRATFYRRQERLRCPVVLEPRPSPPRALTAAQRHDVLDVLRSERFVDQAPAQVYAALLDEGTYLCSSRTMYRILKEVDEVRERRNQLRRPSYTKPELIAIAPNQVWSWDITKLKGPEKWTYYYLYVMLDIFSRYVVGWLIAPEESGSLAKVLMEESYQKQEVKPGQLIIHSDRGPSMTSMTVTQKLADLGVLKCHSRPHVSNDNPFSEAQFKTLKYRPDFPDRFGSIQDARVFCQGFFPWYNREHYHSGIGLLTPEVVHYGRASEVIDARQVVLSAAYAAHPERFVKQLPRPQAPPREVWINPPTGPGAGRAEERSSQRTGSAEETCQPLVPLLATPELLGRGDGQSKDSGCVEVAH